MGCGLDWLGVVVWFGLFFVYGLDWTGLGWRCDLELLCYAAVGWSCANCFLPVWGFGLAYNVQDT